MTYTVSILIPGIIKLYCWGLGLSWFDLVSFSFNGALLPAMYYVNMYLSGTAAATGKGSKKTFGPTIIKCI